MDSGQRFAWITLKTVAGDGFDHSADCGARVRNVPKVGSQSAISRLQAIWLISLRALHTFLLDWPYLRVPPAWTRILYPASIPPKRIGAGPLSVPTSEWPTIHSGRSTRGDPHVGKVASKATRPHHALARNPLSSTTRPGDESLNKTRPLILRASGPVRSTS